MQNCRKRSSSVKPSPCSNLAECVFAVFALCVMIVVSGLSLRSQQKNVDETMYLRVETDRNSYAPGEEVRISITYVNDQKVDVFLSSLSYSLEISNQNEVVLIVTVHQTGEGPVRVQSFSELFVSSYSWNQKGMDRGQVQRNRYTIKVCLLDSTICGATTIDTR